eukprot:Selendium_serpulae@DN5140_c0_g1_i1.p1
MSPPTQSRSLSDFSDAIDALINRIPFPVFVDAEDRGDEIAALDKGKQRSHNPLALMTTCDAIARSDKSKAKSGRPSAAASAAQPTASGGPQSHVQLQERLMTKIAALKQERDSGKQNKRKRTRHVARSGDRDAATGDEAQVDEDLSFGRLISSTKSLDKKRKAGNKARKLQALISFDKQTDASLAALPDARRTERQHQLAVDRAMSKASGQRVKDSSVAEKQLKNLGKRKDKSRTQWDARKAKIETSQADRQKERKENITLYRTKAGKAALRSERDRRRNDEAAGKAGAEGKGKSTGKSTGKSVGKSVGKSAGKSAHSGAKGKSGSKK